MLNVEFDDLLIRYACDSKPPDYFPRFNIAPGQMIVVVIHDGVKNRIGELKWGLIPSWAKDEKIGYRTINARAESLTEKPSFQIPFQRKRCIIPVDGFYEWKQEGGSKQAMRIMMKNERTFSIAGLYETWIAPDGKKISSCTIITTTPNRLVATIHDRMPAILRPEDEALWLDRREQDPIKLQALLKPYPEQDMVAYPVPPLSGP